MLDVFNSRSRTDQNRWQHSYPGHNMNKLWRTCLNRFHSHEKTSQFPIKGSCKKVIKASTRWSLFWWKQIMFFMSYDLWKNITQTKRTPSCMRALTRSIKSLSISMGVEKKTNSDFNISRELIDCFLLMFHESMCLPQTC